MIKNLAKLKYWELAALGVSTSVVTVLLLAFATRLLAGTWPQTTEAGYIAYIIAAAFTSWIISGIFTEAAFQKRRNALVQQGMDEVMDLYAGYYIAGAGRHRAEEPYDQEADRG
jgi:uncharacterized membrane protein (DUF485 family)